MVHEAVINAARHGGAKAVEVRVEAGQDRVRLLVADNGRGPSPSGPVSTSSAGRSRSIRARRGCAWRSSFPSSARGHAVPLKLVLADDHPIVLDGLEQLFRAQKDVTVVARCQDGVETLRAVRQHRPDVLLLDIRMPAPDGLQVIRTLQKDSLPTRIVLLTVELSEDDVLEAVRLGVKGVVLKEMSPQMLMECVRKVADGEQWIERRSLTRALDKMLCREAGFREVSSVLTSREIEIVRLATRGLRNQAIAEQLHISEGTVKVHLHNIYEKLGIDGRVGLTLYAREKGLL
jgi:DNA-binding NarL/FixJ family response regulator